MAKLKGYDYKTLRKLWYEDAISGREITIGNNTTAEYDDDLIKVRLHGHLILVLHPDGKVWGRDCGWATVTTKDRLNAFGGYVFQRGGIWFTNTGPWDHSGWNEWVNV